MFGWEERLLRGRQVRFIAGIDEAGRGPLAGPLVVAAVMLKPQTKRGPYSLPNFKNRIADSKLLTARQRERAFSEIMAKAWVGIGIAGVDLIDNFNLTVATRFAVEAAIDNLRKDPQYILDDGGIVVPSRYTCSCLIKGETRSFSIACASIVAKVVRDRIMITYDRIFPQYEFQKHKGYGTRLHIRLLKKYGPSPIHRKSFEPVSAWF